MKTTTTLLLGAISSLLLTAGLVQAAQALDPLTRNSQAIRVAEAKPTPDCTTTCWLV